ARRGGVQADADVLPAGAAAIPKQPALPLPGGRELRGDGTGALSDVEGAAAAGQGGEVGRGPAARRGAEVTAGDDSPATGNERRHGRAGRKHARRAGGDVRLRPLRQQGRGRLLINPQRFYEPPLNKNGQRQMTDPYAVLGLPPDCDDDTIRR